MPYRRGEVVLILFPDPNLRTAKRRPVLVVQADNPRTGLAQTIVAMITLRRGPALGVAVLLHQQALAGRRHPARLCLLAAAVQWVSRFPR